jgi:peptide/nickel transport system permease protein
MRQSPFICVVAVLFLAICLMSFVGPWVVQSGLEGNIANRLQAPVWLGGDGGLLGTDQQGRPMTLRLMLGARTTLIVGFLGVLCGAIVGVLSGLAAGYFGGRTEALIVRLAEIQMSFPALLLAMTIVTVAGGGVTVVVLALGLNSWMVYALLVRSTVLRFRANEFILATVNLGAGPGRIIFGHLLPNAVPVIMSLATLELARLMLAEATLSFLGFGVQPPTVSLGSILGEGREYLYVQWWVSTFPGIALALIVLCANLLGSWAQRVSDPLGR